MRRKRLKCECGCGLLARRYNRFVFNHHQSRNRKYNTKRFIIKATALHCGKYNYSRTIYDRFQSPIIIICPKHGEFRQMPKSHLRGEGCQQCGMGRTGNAHRTYSDDVFVTNARAIYGDKYDYAQVKANSYSDIISISCRRCGSLFTTTPRAHIRGVGCHQCSQTRRWTTAEFISAACSVHGDSYDYQNVEYFRSTTKVHIVCRVHGGFWQAPRDHIHSAAGCPNCQTSKGEKVVEKILKRYPVVSKKQYKFDDCRGNGRKKLRFDFAIIVDGRMGLIEYHGVQHFRPIGVVTGSNFLNGQARDEKKRRFCIDNHIKLLTIPYYEIKKAPSLIDEFIRTI